MVIKKTIFFFQQKRKKKVNNDTRIEKIGFRDTIAETGSEIMR